ncbi:hypothetical protein JHK85_008613 [Glycine max]|nr:hypothetical protein JHK85_008613 [Glycine max]KAG5073161.1 hypothetical protein JHK86_008372 [Glycine max]
MLEVNPKPRPRPRPVWFDVIAKGIINNKNKITVGLVNIDARVDGNILKQLDALHSQVETISIDFDHVDKNFKWEDIFPERIDENGKWGLPKCPNLPMPALQNYGDLNVVMAKVPCGIRDVNQLTTFRSTGYGNKHELPDDVYTIHYLGLKPWMCYRDYDCNWDIQDHHVFASNSAHGRWWQVYDSMPKELQAYCELTEKMNERIVKWRRIARNASLSDGHWKIKVQDPTRGNYYPD